MPSLSVQCVHGGETVQHVVPTADSGGSPLSYIWGCETYKNMLRASLGFERSPGRPADQPAVARSKRIRAQSRNWSRHSRSQSPAPAAPSMPASSPPKPSAPGMPSVGPWS